MQLEEYETLIRRITQEVYFYLQKLGAPAADAQDIVQDAFVRLIETEQIIPEAKIRAWIYRSSIRLWIDRTRRNQRYQVVLRDYQTLLGDWQLTSGPDLDTALLQLDDAAMFRLTLRYVQQLSIKQMAQILGESDSKVKVDLFRIRQQLKQIMEANNE